MNLDRERGFGILRVARGASSKSAGRTASTPSGLSEQFHELFSRPMERTTGTDGGVREARPGKELI